MAYRKSSSSQHMINPLWVSLIRSFIGLISLIIFGLAAYVIHDVYIDELGFALATALMTWIATAYIVSTERVASWRVAHNVIAILVLDGFLLILWLACFASVAAKRSKFVVPVSVDDCYNDGSVTNSEQCLSKREAVLFAPGLASMSAVAGLGALVWLLYIVCFVDSLTLYLGTRKEASNGTAGGYAPSAPQSMTDHTAGYEPHRHTQTGVANQPYAGYPTQSYEPHKEQTADFNAMQGGYPNVDLRQQEQDLGQYQAQTHYQSQTQGYGGSPVHDMQQQPTGQSYQSVSPPTSWQAYPNQPYGSELGTTAPAQYHEAPGSGMR